MKEVKMKKYFVIGIEIVGLGWEYASPKFTNKKDAKKFKKSFMAKRYNDNRRIEILRTN